MALQVLSQPDEKTRERSMDWGNRGGMENAPEVQHGIDFQVGKSHLSRLKLIGSSYLGVWQKSFRG